MSPQKPATTVTYVTAADTNKLIRKLLAETFPDTKFRVKLHGRNHAIVTWTDGPSYLAVEAATHYFVASNFDPMEDLASAAYQTGEDGNRVRFGTDYITVERTIGTEAYTAAAAELSGWIGTDHLDPDRVYSTPNQLDGIAPGYAPPCASGTALVRILINARLAAASA